MPGSDKNFIQNPYFWLPILLVFPALLINLGVIPFIDDEAIRALVSFEMKASGNYIIPTLHGTHYYSKPPLFNWILLLFFEILGSWDEFTARLPVLLSTLGFSATIYYSVKQNLGKTTAFISAFAFITCGRILFWDSFLALIDITYSWVTFASFLVIFHYWKKKNWLALFIFSYLLTAIGFMLKGFPSIVFQGATLGAWLLYQKEIKKLFTWQHLLGLFLFSIIIGGYYYTSNLYNENHLITKGLLEQASSRTILEQGLMATVLHIISFPLEMSYHFLPWSFLFIYFFKNNIISKIKAHPFLLFLTITFLVNIPVYWTSPRIYPRYLLMLLPLLFIIGIHLHQEGKGTNHRKIVAFFFGIFVVIFTSGSVLPLFLERNYELDFVLLKVSFLVLSLVFLSFQYFRTKKDNRLLIFISILLLTRIGFNWFVLPDRAYNGNGSLVKSTAIQVAERTTDRPLYVYKKTLMQPTNSFYLSITRGAIIPRVFAPLPKEGLYIIEPSKYPESLDYYQDSMYMRHNADRYFYIGKLK